MEASLIYPVIITVTIMFMAASLFFYNMAAELSDMNRCVRRNAGEQSGTVFYGEEVSTSGGAFSISERSGLLSGSITAESRGRFVIPGIIPIREDMSYGAKVNVICETDTVRKKQGISDAIEELGG